MLKRLENMKEKPSDPLNTLNSSSVPQPQQPSPFPNSNLVIICSICANPILDYKPKYFLGEKFNPACEIVMITLIMKKMGSHQDLINLKSKSFFITPRGFNHRPTTLAVKSFSSHPKCSHSKQCLIREPFPPPYPSLIPVENMNSLYHLKFLSGDFDYWVRTCSYCMRVHYEKYGCESCVWLKLGHCPNRGILYIFFSKKKRYGRPFDTD